MTTNFSPVKIVSLFTTSLDAIGFFESVALSDYEGEWIRLSVADQRGFFGNAPFGKRMFKVSRDGLVSVMRSVAFGTDFDEQTGRYDHAAKQWVSDHDGHPFHNNEFPR